MTETTPAPQSEFVTFWNEVLVPKFIKYKHVLVADLTALLKPHATADGVHMASSSWVISARTPD